MDRHRITREIGIDAGHRVPDHGSKCRNLHGHRYRVIAHASGPLAAEGEQSGMVVDFGFLKTGMMDLIDAPCDHGMILSVNDPLLPIVSGFIEPDMDEVRERVQRDGFAEDRGECGKLYVVPFTPTAENLARHWFQRLAARVYALSGGRAQLDAVEVFETPNCSAVFSR